MIAKPGSVGRSRVAVVAPLWLLLACQVAPLEPAPSEKLLRDYHTALDALGELDEDDAQALTEGFLEGVGADGGGGHSHGNGFQCTRCVLLVTGALEIPVHTLNHAVKAKAPFWRIAGREAGEAVCGFLGRSMGVDMNVTQAGSTRMFSLGSGADLSKVISAPPSKPSSRKAKAKKSTKARSRFGRVASVMAGVSSYLNPLAGLRQAREDGGIAFRQWCNNVIGLTVAFVTEQLTHWGGHLLVGRGVCGLMGQCGGTDDERIVCEGLTAQGETNRRYRVSFDTRARALLGEVFSSQGSGLSSADSIVFERAESLPQGSLAHYVAKDGSTLTLQRESMSWRRADGNRIQLRCAVEPGAPPVSWSAQACDDALEPPSSAPSDASSGETLQANTSLTVDEATEVKVAASWDPPLSVAPAWLRGPVEGATWKATDGALLTAELRDPKTLVALTPSRSALSWSNPVSGALTFSIPTSASTASWVRQVNQINDCSERP